MTGSSTHHGADTWTTRKLLAWMSDAFTRNELDSPRLFAELLLAHVLGCDRLKLYMDADRPASELERTTLRELVGRALKNEPVQYLVGEAWFYGLPLHVDRRVLVPRPSTETIIEQVLQHARAEPGFGGKNGEGVCLADIGTGSGAIALVLLKNMNEARALATDISGDALEVARRNAQRHGLGDRVEFLKGDLLGALQDHPAGRDLHYLVSNPPYIPDDEWQSVDANVKDYEPHGALRGGEDGMKFVRPLVEGAPALIRARGLLLVEIAAATAGAVLEMAKGHPLLENARIEQDLEGHPRVLVARRKGN
jgi:release factor glutamine methyltransferase